MTATAERTLPATRAATPGAVWAALVVVYLVWGSTYLAIRILVETMPPLLSAGARFVVAALILGTVIALRSGVSALRVDRRQLGAAAIVGTLLCLGGNGLVTLGEQTVPSALAALIVAVVPLWVVLLRTATGDRPRAMTYGGVLLGFLGLVVLVVPGSDVGGATVAGVLTIVAATVCWAVGSFFSARLPLPPNTYVASTWEMLTGGAVMLLLALGRGEASGLDVGAFSARSWLALAYLITFGSLLAFTSYVWLLSNAPISLVATYAYVNPVVAVILGALILAEPVTAAILIGGGIVVAGVAIVVSTERPRRTPPS